MAKFMKGDVGLTRGRRVDVEVAMRCRLGREWRKEGETRGNQFGLADHHVRRRRVFDPHERDAAYRFVGIQHRFDAFLLFRCHGRVRIGIGYVAAGVIGGRRGREGISHRHRRARNAGIVPARDQIRQFLDRRYRLVELVDREYHPDHFACQRQRGDRIDVCGHVILPKSRGSDLPYSIRDVPLPVLAPAEAETGAFPPQIASFLPGCAMAAHPCHCPVPEAVCQLTSDRRQIRVPG